jgi:hypothetical protein
METHRVVPSAADKCESLTYPIEMQIHILPAMHKFEFELNEVNTHRICIKEFEEGLIGLFFVHGAVIRICIS